MKLKTALIATVASCVATAPAFGQTGSGEIAGAIENKIQALQSELEKLQGLEIQLHELQQQLDAMKATEAAAKQAAATAVREPAAREASKKPVDVAPALRLAEYETIQDIQLVAPAARPRS